ncbi:hypothetical protein AHAT_19110 [Agarivorans sp. Toyoura001]|uniref:rolling circle replication-associated protein n=1 Tax=Agarivorans sp. Toyoura001 TaxID=2283141 RepID=UPI0010DDB4BC|nr:hypothetical protein [Agarivorans sp. Toyoura001]GDY26021.1 hypothetical protein AHAT_19110 [Agarivorans sp. Toyoura001]
MNSNTSAVKPVVRQRFDQIQFNDSIIDDAVSRLCPAFFSSEIPVNQNFTPLNHFPVSDLGEHERKLRKGIQLTSPAGLAKPEAIALSRGAKVGQRSATASDSAKARFYFDSHKLRELHKLETHADNRQLQQTVLAPFAATHNEINPSRVCRKTGEVYATHNPIARIYKRDWANQYRVRVEASVSNSEPPSANQGERITSELNSRAASKIMDSGAYVQVAKGGFTTFLTLTFDTAARARIVSGESTIGAEVSRFFSAAKKMYQRGWVCDEKIVETRNGIDCIGASAVPEETQGEGEFDYIWCAEMPDNQDGEPNPHCHVLLRWSVPRVFFDEWAKRLEKLWGLGFAKLERIRNANAASGYLLKALGYVAKGSKSDQGEIRGNRYNISKGARAPAWECIASYEADNMTAIINELKDRWNYENRWRFAQIKAKKDEASQAQKAYDKIKFAKKPKLRSQADKLRSKIDKLSRDISGVYQTIKAKGARASDYHITITGKERLDKFLSWASGSRGWNPQELDAMDSGELGHYRKPLQVNQSKRISTIISTRKAWRNAAKWSGLLWFLDTHEKVKQDVASLSDWLEYQQMELPA